MTKIVNLDETRTRQSLREAEDALDKLSELLPYLDQLPDLDDSKRRALLKGHEKASTRYLEAAGRVLSNKLQSMEIDIALSSSGLNESDIAKLCDEIAECRRTLAHILPNGDDGLVQ